MTVYVLFLSCVILWSLFLGHVKGSQEERRRLFLNGAFIVMYMIYALRSSAVGRDFPGYERIYLMTRDVPWNDFNYVYFENGYILLMKICTALGMTFQMFTAVTYAIVILPLYMYIKKYSRNYLMSMLVYIGYMFFEFSLTGVRQALATSIILIGYMILIEAKRYRVLMYIASVAIASFFHKGAYIGFMVVPMLLIQSLRVYAMITTIMSTALVFVRPYIMQFVKQFFEKETMNASAGTYIGLNFLFTVLLAVAFFYIGDQKRKNYGAASRETYSTYQSVRRQDLIISDLNTKIFMLGIPVLILFGSDTAVRSYVMLIQVILVQLPNYIESFSGTLRSLLRYAFGVFFVAFFFIYTLIPNNFDIVPYVFFWQR